MKINVKLTKNTVFEKLAISNRFSHKRDQADFPVSLTFEKNISDSMQFHFSILTWTFSHLVFPLGDTSVVHGWHGGLESLIKVMISLEKRDTLVVYGGGEFFKNGTYLLVTTTIKASIVMQKSSFSP